MMKYESWSLQDQQTFYLNASPFKGGFCRSIKSYQNFSHATMLFLLIDKWKAVEAGIKYIFPQGTGIDNRKVESSGHHRQILSIILENNVSKRCLGKKKLHENKYA